MHDAFLNYPFFILPIQSDSIRTMTLLYVAHPEFRSISNKNLFASAHCESQQYIAGCYHEAKV
jgi:hypothetical protein